jgi:hypothetical protein
MPRRSPPRWTVAGNSPIRMDRDIAAELRQAVNEIIPDALGVMESTVQVFRTEIAGDWPVSPTKTNKKTGETYRLSGKKIPSATLWSAFGSVQANGLVGSIGNPAPYTYLIKSRQNGLAPGRSAYQQLVKEPAAKIAIKLGEDIGKSIVKTVTSET